MYKKLYFYIFFPTLLFLLGLYFASEKVLERGINSLHQENLRDFAFSIIEGYGESLFSIEKRDELFTNLLSLDSLTGNRITVIDTSGIVIFDTRKNPKNMDNHRWRPEVVEALDGKIGFFQRESQTLKRRMFYCAVPVIKGDTIIGVLRVSEPEEKLFESYKKFKTNYIIFILVVSAVIFLILTILESKYRKDIFLFLQAFKKLSENDFSVKILRSKDDPLRELAEHFNATAEKLMKSYRALQETEQKLKEILETIPIPIAIVDNQLNLIYSNLSFKKLFSSDVGTDLSTLTSLEILRHARAILKEKADEIKYEILWKERHLQVYLKKLGDIPQIIIIAIDITDTFEKERIKKELITHVSHDLRTPLTIIKGYAETILEENSDSKINSYVETILKAVDELSQLVAKLNTLSKLENLLEVEIKEINLKDFIESIIIPFEHIASKKGLEFHHSIETDTETIKSDPEKLKMILINLLDNALKFTEKGKVELNIEKKGNKLKITVSDTGPGIPENLRARIFERFFTMDKSRGAGFGLGLAIVKHAVQLLKGIIEVESQIGFGTTFTITIPEV
ncbi:MAG: ATP-binding protein [bacterium]|nr:ATP-binding protein [bacterium]